MLVGDIILHCYHCKNTGESYYRTSFISFHHKSYMYMLPTLSSPFDWYLYYELAVADTLRKMVMIGVWSLQKKMVHYWTQRRQYILPGTRTWYGTQTLLPTYATTCLHQSTFLQCTFFIPHHIHLSSNHTQWQFTTNYCSRFHLCGPDWLQLENWNKVNFWFHLKWTCSFASFIAHLQVLWGTIIHKEEGELYSKKCINEF